VDRWIVVSMRQVGDVWTAGSSREELRTSRSCGESTDFFRLAAKRGRPETKDKLFLSYRRNPAESKVFNYKQRLKCVVRVTEHARVSSSSVQGVGPGAQMDKMCQR